MRKGSRAGRHGVSRWLVAVGMTVASMGGMAAPAWAVPGVSGVEVARSCPLINIGTPDRPRMVKDPACQSGR